MTSIVKFQPLSGALNEGPYCYLLQIDDFKILLDCGWNETFDDSILENIKKYLPQVDAILLSHLDIPHIGALPALLKNIPPNCRIYATVPVFQMGQLTLKDQFKSYATTSNFTKFTLEDVDTLFKKITPVKKNELIHLDDYSGVSIQPVHSGRLIGGAAWKIMTQDNEDGDIVYAVDFNHKRDRHLNKTSLVDSEIISRSPQLLITDSYNATYTHERRKDRDQKLINIIQNTLDNNGNVLIVSDTAGRVLELAILLDLYWTSLRSRLGHYALAMVSHEAENVQNSAKSMVEWMCDDIAKKMTDDLNNPFNFKNLKVFPELKRIVTTPQPKCIIATMNDLESGFARQLFSQWGTDPRNYVILTSRAAKGTLARQLMENPTMSHITLKMSRHEPLDGEDLENYLREEALKTTKNRKKEELYSDSDDSDDENEPERAGYSIEQPPPKKKQKTSFFKQPKKLAMMYSYQPKLVQWDEYGEAVRPEDFATNEPIKEVDENDEVNEDKEVVEKSEDNSPQPKEEIPFKQIEETVELDIKCRITYIDFEGRSNSSSLLQVVKSMNPREVILVRGSEHSTDEHAFNIRTSLGGTVPVPVHKPKVNDVIDTTKHRHIYQVRMTDHLMNSLKFSKVKDFEVAWIDAKVDYLGKMRDKGEVMTEKEIEDVSHQDSSAVKIRNYSSQDEFEEDQPNSIEKKPSHMSIADDFDYTSAIPSLYPLPVDEIPKHSTCYVNEVKISEFRKVVEKAGMTADFVSGVLVCNGLIAIRKNGFNLELEGPLCEDYFKVKDLLYKQFAVV